MVEEGGCWWWAWERQDGRVFRAKGPEATLRSAARAAFDSECEHCLPIGGVRLEVLSHSTEGTLVSAYVSDGDGYVPVDVEDLGELLLTAGVN
jgi:hypothetical protein